ncbi:MAG TPA: hypothetical protein VLH94_04945 [Spirochaetia bacterium]|nr:hypothetical protein [Spirochaetia bacterium]
MKKGLIYLISLLGLYVFVRNVWAYDLTLTSVGTQSTLGTNYSLVTYTGGIPSLSGTASPSAQVGVKIKTSLNYTTASTSGVWSYIPSVLDQGDSLITITSGTQSISFTLRFNATVSAAVATPAALPDESELLDAGSWQYYIPALALGFGVFFFGRYGKKRMHKWEKGD